jgi:hypothetical protein
MFVPKRASQTFQVANAKSVTNGPLEVVFADVPLAPPPDCDLEGLGEIALQFSPVVDAVQTTVDYWTSGWNSGFHLGHARNLQAFSELCPVVKCIRNPNIAIAPRVSGYSELHGLLAALCSDEVLANNRLTRRPGNFLLSPLSVPKAPHESNDMFGLRLRAEAKSCSDAFRDYAWGRLVRGGRFDYAPDSSLRVLFDDTPFWMNAAYRAATRRARALLRPLPDTLPTELMDHYRMLDLFGHVMAVPAFGPDERAEVRYVDDHVYFRLGRLVGGDRGSSGEVGRLHLGSGCGQIVVYGVSGNSLEECDARMSDLLSCQYQPLSTTFQDTGLKVMPVLGEGELWNLSDARGREEAFMEILGPSEQASLEPILAVLQRQAMPEDLRDKGWSYVKEDVHRRFYRKPRKGQKRMQVVCVETIDDFPVVDPSALLVEEDELLRSVMVVLDPREERVIVMLRLGRTQNQIAKELGLSDHSGVSRVVKNMEPKVRQALGQDPAPPRVARRSRKGNGGQA